MAISLAAQGRTMLQKNWSAAAQSTPASVPELHFDYAIDAGGAIRQVLVNRGNGQVQALDSCTGQDVPRANGLGELSREDFNFDGYPDLMMRVAFDPQTNNSSYCIWLYDPKTQTFVLSDELSQLTNPWPDPNNKTVLARKNVLCSEQCYVQETYAWSNGHLEPVREESLTEDSVVTPMSDCRWVWEVKKEKNGKLVDIDRERVDSGGVMCEPHFGW